jgi:hypothetical protein
MNSILMEAFKEKSSENDYKLNNTLVSIFQYLFVDILHVN